MNISNTDEWLEADGLGGFASGTVSGVRTRRYHALLLTATSPPTGRVVLVNGFEAWLETPAGTVALTSQAYSPDVVHPDGRERIETFTIDPWPRWLFRLPDGTSIEHEIFVPRGASMSALSWKASGPATGVLCVRLLLSGRDYHSLHHENPGFSFAAEERPGALGWRPYPDVPGITVHSNGAYAADPTWYRNFRYDEERARGLDFTEDLAAPGVLRFDLATGEAFCVLTAEGHGTVFGNGEDPAVVLDRLRRAERARRATFSHRLERAADAYVVDRGQGKTIVAGYPWFTDWGRDTFIALRGICFARGQYDVARDILLEWAGALSAGMLPNRFPDRGEAPEFNAVDASLWYVIVVQELIDTGRLTAAEEKRLLAAVDAILEGYVHGTRHRIHLDEDGLLAAGEAGVQLTWMDAKVGDWVVTPRIGKPVEVQALWLNALAIAGRRSARWQELFTRGRAAFEARFWDETRGYLADVVDGGHAAGAIDWSLRPNQIFAVGGLPLVLLPPERARRVVDAVERRLWTPLGLRSLAPGEPGYAPHYAGGVRERDGAYHQGTVWPWLLGPFVEAWVRVRGDNAETRREARENFLDPILEHLDTAGLGHVSEVADAEPPHHPGGCPFQAWSVGEALRLDNVVLREDTAPRGRSSVASRVSAAAERATMRAQKGL